MGMLMHRHRVRQMQAEAEGEAKPKRRRRKASAPVETHAPEKAPEAELAKGGAVERPEGEPDGGPDTKRPADPYAELTDEQVLEAYATNVPDGEADNRDAMVSELQALEAEAHDTK